MKKPLHWKEIGEENRAILSAVALLNLNFALISIDLKLEKEELDSIIWGYWEENKKELRPLVYSQWKCVLKIVKKIRRRIKNG